MMCWNTGFTYHLGTQLIKSLFSGYDHCVGAGGRDAGIYGGGKRRIRAETLFIAFTTGPRVGVVHAAFSTR